MIHTEKVSTRLRTRIGQLFARLRWRRDEAALNHAQHSKLPERASLTGSIKYREAHPERPPLVEVAQSVINRERVPSPEFVASQERTNLEQDRRQKSKLRGGQPVESSGP